MTEQHSHESQDSIESDDSHEHRPSGEMVKFILLVLVSLGVVLVMRVSRPYVFEKLVPSILGLDQQQTALPQSVDEPAIPPAEEAHDGETEDAYPYPAEADSPPGTADESVNLPLIEGGDGEGEQAGDAPEAAESERTHIVQPGESLINIAQRYGVTAEQLAAANNILNPNQITIGQTLQIP